MTLNLNLLAQDKVKIAFVMSDALSDVSKGHGSFAKPIVNINQVAALYFNYVQIITSKPLMKKLAISRNDYE